MSSFMLSTVTEYPCSTLTEHTFWWPFYPQQQVTQRQAKAELNAYLYCWRNNQISSLCWCLFGCFVCILNIHKVLVCWRGTRTFAVLYLWSGRMHMLCKCCRIGFSLFSVFYTDRSVIAVVMLFLCECVGAVHIFIY